MEINLTAIWETATAPFQWLTRVVGQRTRSRRQLYSRLSPSEKKLRLIKLLRLIALVTLLAIVTSVIVFFIAFAWVSRDLPEPGKIVRHDGFSTKIFDRNGKLLYDLYADQRRDPVTIDQIPKYLQEATVSTEDKDFYSHQGVDPLTPFRIIYNYIFRGGRLVGGSTLTQQLVKNVLLTNERSVSRKFKELVLALQIERKFTKDQILEMYLNEAPYGGNASGVGAAASMYFGKPVSELNLVQSAILAGLPQSPTAYSPFAGKKDKDGTPFWKERAIGVLRRMNEDGHIDEATYQQAVKDLDTIQFVSPQSQISAPHFVFYVRDQLEKQFGQDVVARGGLQVTTSLDLDLQQKAQKIVHDEIAKVNNVKITNGAAMVMNPKTGEILTMVGSADYNSASIDGKFNVAVDALRQPGSSIKPVTYLAMIQKGFTPATVLVDAPTIFYHNDPHDKTEKPYQPGSYDGKFHGPVSLRVSIGNSLNIPAVKSLAIVGVENFLQLANTMGFPTLAPTQDNLKRFGLAVTLGGAEVHLIDTVSSYSAFANGGTKVDPVSILKVTDSQGNVLYQYHPVEGVRVMKPEEAFLIDSMLSDNNARLLAFGANSLLNAGKAIAVKTGTTNDKKDNWAVGWSQNFIVGTWVGNNDNTAMKQVASGISGASPIWRKIVNAALAGGYSSPDWVVPANVDQVNVDDISGYPAHDNFSSHQEYVIHGTLPPLPDPIHANLKICRDDHTKLATDAKVAANDFDQGEFITLHEDDPVSVDGMNRWQDGINQWVAQQTDAKYKVPSGFCGSNSDLFVRLNTPQDQQKYSEQDITVDIAADSGDGIEKMELWVDGNLNQTINDKTFHGTIHMPTGQHQVYAKAFAHGGKQAQSGTANIGTGGADFQKPASPAPSASPGVSPSPSPGATPHP